MDLILPRFELSNLEQVLSKAIDNCTEQSLDNNVSVNMEIPSLPPISCDSKSLERAFSAILDNAIKFSNENSVVEIRAGQNEDQVWIEIQDYGVGIPKEQLPRIFDRFFHIDEIDGRMFRGAGLGLSIARQVIEQHSGKIKVETALGKGTTVRIYLNKSG